MFWSFLADIFDIFPFICVVALTRSVVLTRSVTRAILSQNNYSRNNNNVTFCNIRCVILILRPCGSGGNGNTPVTETHVYPFFPRHYTILTDEFRQNPCGYYRPNALCSYNKFHRFRVWLVHSGHRRHRVSIPTRMQPRGPHSSCWIFFYVLQSRRSRGAARTGQINTWTRPDKSEKYD